MVWNMELKDLLLAMNTQERESFKKLMNCTKKHGQYVKAVWKSELKPLKNHVEEFSNGVEKVSKSIVRLGINYKNIKGVELSNNENSNFNNWCETVIPNVLYKNVNNGELYLRLYVGKTRAKTTKYYQDKNGNVINDLDTTKFRKSSSSNKLECFTIKLANLISLE